MLIKFTQYTIKGILIYCVIKYIGDKAINDKQIIVLTLLILFVLLVVDHIQFQKNTTDAESTDVLSQFIQPIEYYVPSTKSNTIPIKNIDKVEKLTSIPNIEADGISNMNDIMLAAKQQSFITQVPTYPISTGTIETVPASTVPAVAVPTTQTNIQTPNQEPQHHAEDIPLSSSIPKKVITPYSSETDAYIPNELEYSDYNHVLVTDDYKAKTFEYGYSYLPPDKWYPQPPAPPVCVTNHRSPVFPLYTIGTPMDLKEWDSSRRVTPPDRMNIKYIQSKLNAGL
jgi:hypothetical protein